MMPTKLAVVTALATLVGGLAFADPTTPEETTMTRTANGSFDVKIAQVAEEAFPEGSNLGRYSLEKRYHGELDATARGEMLTAGTPVEGSAAYVAVERVEGALAGRRGTFLLQHRGTMSGGGQELSIAVVPDSGTGELAGLEGTLEVTIAEGGEHLYALHYALPGAP